MPTLEQMDKNKLIEYARELQEEKEKAVEEAYDTGRLEGLGDARNIVEVAEDLDDAYEQIGNLLVYNKDE